MEQDWKQGSSVECHHLDNLEHLDNLDNMEHVDNKVTWTACKADDIASWFDDSPNQRYLERRLHASKLSLVRNSVHRLNSALQCKKLHCKAIEQN